MLIQFSTFILIALISRIWSVRAKFLYIYIYIYIYIHTYILMYLPVTLHGQTVTTSLGGTE